MIISEDYFLALFTNLLLVSNFSVYMKVIVDLIGVGP
jgi:hypothetical protein